MKCHSLIHVKLLQLANCCGVRRVKHFETWRTLLVFPVAYTVFLVNKQNKIKQIVL